MLRQCDMPMTRTSLQLRAFWIYIGNFGNQSNINKVNNVSKPEQNFYIHVSDSRRACLTNGFAHLRDDHA